MVIDTVALGNKYNSIEAPSKEHDEYNKLLRSMIDGVNSPVILIGNDFKIIKMNKAAHEEYAVSGPVKSLHCYQVFSLW